MVQIVADLHLHSKYSRAVSPQMTAPVMATVGKQKGIDLLATGDFTHPLWFREMQKYLSEAEEGLYKIKGKPLRGKGNDNKEVRFLLSVEISCIYSQGGKGRRVHNLVFSPSFATSEKINTALIQRGCNLTSDGRPIIGLSSKQLLEMILEIDERALLIPAHIWTPWFGIYGESSGFHSLEEAFGDLAPYVYGIETGLSSDPEMNWQVKELETRSILSFSDAHSAPKMGREATVFELDQLSYENIRKAIMAPSRSKEQRAKSIENNNRVLYTIEFYPEEGKYHYSGHRKCNVIMTPDQQRAAKGICPVCHRHVTDGVMRRVQELEDDQSRIKNQELRVKIKENEKGLTWLTDPRGIHPPFVKIVPLNEIIAEAIKAPVGSPKVKALFDQLTSQVADEFTLLLRTPLEDIQKALPEQGKKIREGIQKVRAAQVVITPGYDGVYGIVKIWPEREATTTDTTVSTNLKEKEDQLGLQF